LESNAPQYDEQEEFFSAPQTSFYETKCAAGKIYQTKCATVHIL